MRAADAAETPVFENPFVSALHHETAL